MICRTRRTSNLLLYHQLRRPRLANYVGGRLLHSAKPIAPTASGNSAILAPITSDLDRISPRFDLHSSQITVLQSPSRFYDTLKEKISNAKRRVFLSTLYIGKDEDELVSALRSALLKNPNLKVSILTDLLRGTREAPNQCSASLLSPLITEFSNDRVEVRMFHTPNLVGIKRQIVPRRINEGWGLQHMKLYGVDDELIISGANLSSDYFTNRQDRYHVFSSGELTSYFEKIHKAVCSLSFLIQPNSDAKAGFTGEWPISNGASSPLVDRDGFRKSASALLTPLMKPAKQIAKDTDTNTAVYPIFQFTPILQHDSSTELPALRSILDNISKGGLKGCHWTFTAGYFNMTPEIQRLLLASKPSGGLVIAASPWANGFYGSGGLSGLLPAAYSLLSRRFLRTVRNTGLEELVRIREWRRGTVNQPDGWTYHAKGLWITTPGADQPSITVVGSSNYTKRSHSLDLEANVAIVTEDRALMKVLKDEELNLQQHTYPVDEAEYTKAERRVGLHVRLAMWIVSIVGGAL